MVAEGRRILPALPTLAMLLQEAGDHRQCRPGTVTTLQPKSDDQKSRWITPKCKVSVISSQGYISCVVINVCKLSIKDKRKSYSCIYLLLSICLTIV